MTAWHDDDFNPAAYYWECLDCGYQSNERWLMCPECSTAEDWAEIRRLVEAM